jgi:hypothetical protein
VKLPSARMIERLVSLDQSRQSVESLVPALIHSEMGPHVDPTGESMSRGMLHGQEQVMAPLPENGGGEFRNYLNPGRDRRK